MENYLINRHILKIEMGKSIVNKHSPTFSLQFEKFQLFTRRSLTVQKIIENW